MHKMKRIGYTGCLVLAVAFTLFGCSAKGKERIEITSEGKKITLLNYSIPKENESAGTTDDFSIKKIDKYEGVRGEDWIDNDVILVTRENFRLEPIQVFDTMDNVRNLYTYNIKTGKENIIYDETQYLWMPIVSPDKKHILVQHYDSGKNSGLILDLNGKTEVTVTEENTEKGLYLSYNNAKWVSNEEIIVPASNEGVCLINVNSNIEMIDDIDLMQTDTAVMAGNKIYYISVDRNLMSYDIAKKQKEIVKKNVLDFELSPNKDTFAIEKKISDSKSALVLIDLNGNEQAALTEAKAVFGMSWSPDQSKIAYLLSSEVESESGLYIMDLSNKSSLYVSPDFMGIDNGLEWNPTGNKILVSISEVKDMKLADNSYIITLN